MKARVVRSNQVVETPQWRAIIQPLLDGVDTRLIELAHSPVAAVQDVARHLIAAGGKRLRPSLVILSALAASGKPDRDRIISIAATVECLHMASLVHDDVIDHSDSRRGRVTANAFWGNKISILSGDCMLAKAFSVLSVDGDARIMKAISDVAILMSEIEVLQAMCKQDVEQWRKSYWRIIRHKTAGFLGVCCKSGAILAGTSSAEENALENYGIELGMAFQLTDDLLDIIGDENETGKPSGGDFRDGKVTLPVILALDCIDADERESLSSMIERDNLTADEVAFLCRKVRESGAMEMVQDQAQNYIDRAVAHLDILPPSREKEALISLANHIIDRKR